MSKDSIDSNRRIKFGDVKIGATARRHINECLDNNWVTMGPKVKEFEKEWAKISGAKYCAAVNSGTSAVLAMCASLYDSGANPGDEIIVPALSFCASWNAIIAAGFKPVPVDIDIESLNIDTALVENNISSKTRAILAVALMGKPFDAHILRDIADNHNLKLFGDCCESHLCRVNNVPLEDIADACAYSFFSAHCVFACEMGAVCSNNEDIINLVKSIRSHGRPVDSLYFSHERFGLNLKPTDIHASIGLEGIENAKYHMCRRRTTSYKITESLKKYTDIIHIVEERSNDINCPHAVSITFRKCGAAKERIGDLKKTLSAANIEWKRNFGAITQHEAFRHVFSAKAIKDVEGAFPNAEWVGDHGIHIPCHAYMDDDDVYAICRVLDHFLDKL
jgi:dTDP-4-amino-4,6-dideoxygalactose transaminase